ncbi:MAG: hypothetical protein R2760_05750 [Chitinophagales bacterium]
MPHLYDIVLDTELSGEADGNRVEYMFHQLATSRKKLNLPTIIGEWGAFYSGGKELMGAAKLMTDGIDSLLFGDFYWSYYKEMGNQILFQKVLLRPYMQVATGQILKQTIQGNTFKIDWQEAKKSKSKNLIFLPYTKNLNIQGKAKYNKIDLENPGSSIIEIAPIKKSKKRHLTITWED